MTSEWREVSVGELGTVVTGRTPKTAIAENYGGSIPFLTPSDDMSVKYAESTAKKLTSRGLSEVKNCLLPPHSICVSCIGSDLGKVVMTTRETVTNQQINSIIPADSVDADFVYYAMLILGRELNYISKTSTAVPIVNKSSFSGYTIKLPDLEEQRAISSVLSALDARIAVNRKINRHLQQMAQAIFKSWFVDFEPFGGAMPDDWREGTLSDICSYNSERIPVASLTLDTYVSTENMSADKGGFIRATSLPTTPQTTAFAIGDTLVSNIRPYFKKIVYCGFAGGCSTDVLCFRPHEVNLSLYVYNVLYNDSFFGYMVAGSKGTKMPRGDKQQIMDYYVVVPSDTVLDDFTSTVAPMMEKRLLLTGESAHLAELRDTLLPRLMSGELSVADIGDAK